jgi:serine/threonine protein kinase/lipoprotein NlpI
LGPQSGISLAACAHAAEVRRLLDGTLDETLAEAVSAHLDACAACRRLVTADADAGRLEDDLKWAAEAERSQTPDIHPPLRRLNELLTDYEVLSEKGRGGMGVVYRARHRKLNRLVALKVLPALLGAVRPDAIARFRREAELAARLEHTNIVGVYDYGEVEGTLYYAMQLIEGRTLRDILHEIQETGAIDVVVGAAGSSDARSLTGDVPQAAQPSAVGEPRNDVVEPSAQSAIRGQVPRVGPQSKIQRLGSSGGSDRAYYRQVARWMAQVAEGLQYAHEHGVVHRDVKPSNLLVNSDGRMMISDFGLARGQDVPSMTASRALLGTARYMSPEQVDEHGGRVDGRTDVYGLGATLYELLALRPMFAAADDREVLDCVLNKEPVPPRRCVRRVPAELETICLKAVEKDPAQRYQTAQDLRDDLERWLLDLPITARRPSTLVRVGKFVRRRKLPVALGAAAVVLLVAASVFYVANRTSHREAAAAQSLAESRRVQLLVDETEQELSAGRLASALEKANAGLAEQPDSADLLRLRGEVLHHLGREDEALAIYERLLARDPDDWKTQYGMIFLLQTNEASPLFHYDKAESVRRTIPREERQRRVAHHREQVLRIRPESAEAYYLLAEAEADPHRAITLLDQALERCPTLGEALLARSRRYHQIGDAPAMLLDAERATTHRPGWAVMHGQRADAFSVLGRHKEAEEAYTAAIEREPQYAAWWHNRGLEKCSLGRFAEALGDANRAVELDPDFAYAYLGRARAQAGLGRMDQALADYARALELSPADVEIYQERGAAYLNAGKLEDATADMTRVIELAPSDARAYGNRAVAYIVMKRYDRAIADLTRCIELEPRNAKAHRNRGHARALNEQYVEAVSDYTRAMEIEPGVPGDLSSRANLFIYLGQYEKAIADLTRLIELGEGPASVLLQRGMAYELSDAPRLALADYVRASAQAGPTGQYAKLGQYILLRQGRQAETAAAVLAGRDATDASAAWTDRLFALFAGELTADDLLAAAATDDERAEAYFYIGRQALLDGKPDAAREAFTKCVALQRSEVLETDFARALLKQVEGRAAAGRAD